MFLRSIGRGCEIRHHKIFLCTVPEEGWKEAKFMNFGREKHKFQAFQASAQQNSHQKHEEETEHRILCSSDKCQVPGKS